MKVTAATHPWSARSYGRWPMGRCSRWLGWAIANRKSKIENRQGAVLLEVVLALVLFVGAAAVIAGARAFIGTYGGFAYLAPLCGVNTIAVYTIRNVYSAFAYHLDFVRHVIDRVDGGSLTLVDLAAGPVLAHLAPSA